MFKNTQITKKFPLAMVTFAILSAIITGAIAYTNAKNGLTVAYESKIESLLESRKASVLSYVDRTKKEVGFYVKNPFVVDAMKSFSDGWQLLPKGKKEYLKGAYIGKNPFTLDERSSMHYADDGTKYSEVHRKHHPVFKHLRDVGSFHDIFIFNIDGELIYSVSKEDDFAENLVNGRLKDTGLANVFVEINENPVAGKLIYVDYKPYLPSGNTPASFIGGAVFDEENNYIGVLAFQMPIEPLDEIMQVTAGMGDSGETYLVGSDLLMRSNSRFYAESSILKTKVDTPSVQRALQGKKGIAVIQDYRGVSVVSAYETIRFFDKKWAVIAEIDSEEVMAPVNAMSTFLVISGVLLVFVIAFLGRYLALDIANPIVEMTSTMNRLANNDLGTNINVDRRADEVGSMADALVIFKANAIERNKLHKEVSYLANHDSLTGLPSRKCAVERLNELLEQALESKTELALMFIDLDNFKPINDTYGHGTGDKILENVAVRLKRCITEVDIAARLGGDEFIVIFPEVKSHDVIKNIAKDILLEINNITVPGVDHELSASIGISFYPSSGKDGEALLKRADIEMYKAKNSGKNNYSYS